MEFAWIGGAIASLPPELRFLVILIALGLIYMKFIAPKSDGAIAERMEELDTHLTNHLTHDIQDLRDAIKDNTNSLRLVTDAIRDLQEETHRVRDGMNVVLSKQDQTRDILIEVRGKVGG